MVQQLATDVYSRYAAFLNQIGVPFFFCESDYGCPFRKKAKIMAVY